MKHNYFVSFNVTYKEAVHPFNAVLELDYKLDGLDNFRKLEDELKLKAIGSLSNHTYNVVINNFILLNN